MSVENSLKLLGVSEGASFDDILRAKKTILAYCKDDPETVAQVEAAYGMLLMQSLTQRRAGKVVNNSVRYAMLNRLILLVCSTRFNCSICIPDSSEFVRVCTSRECKRLPCLQPASYSTQPLELWKDPLRIACVGAGAWSTVFASLLKDSYGKFRDKVPVRIWRRYYSNNT